MGKNLIPEDNDGFEEMLDEMYMKYHYHQSSVPNFKLTDAQLAELAHNDTTGSSLAGGQGGRSKKVTFHRNENWCNGLPRKR